MPKLPLWTAADAESALLAAGFEQLRSKGSHRIYGHGSLRVTIPLTAEPNCNPKIVEQTLEQIEAAKLTPDSKD